MYTGMIVRQEDFETRPHPVLSDPDLSDEMKAKLKESGLADAQFRAEILELVDECFNCGQKLTTPFIYWNGATGKLCLHAKCAASLSLGLVQDTFELDTGKRAESEMDAADWLRVFAQKKIYGAEDD